nr:DUF1294 domain-containing protein [Paenibacillus sp. H1-7]
MLFLLTYLAVLNIAGFMMMGYDKSQAVHHGRRVPEKRLFAVAAVGGALGAWLGMKIYRHKTKHLSFVIGLPVLFVLNMVCIYYFTDFYYSD